MPNNTESENDKRIRLGEEMVKNLIEIYALEGKKIKHMKLNENGIFYVLKEGGVEDH